MFKRELAVVYGDHLEIYETMVEEATQTFSAKLGDLSVFHRILIDRVADSYVQLLKCDSPGGSGSQITEKSDLLKKWLSSALSELHSALTERKARELFYEKMIDIVEELVNPMPLRREILRRMRDVAESEK
jgi:hypothetical protein